MARLIAALLFLATSLPVLAGDPGADAVKVADHRTSTWTLISDVKLVRAGGGVEIQITADRPLRARSRRLHDPERFVVDLQDTILAGDNLTIDVDSADIKSVRIAPLYQQEGRITRVVVDLAAPRQLDLNPVGNTLIVKVVAVDAAAEWRDSSAQRDSTGKSETQLSSANGAAQLNTPDGPVFAPTLDSQVQEGRRESQPAPNAISAQLASGTPVLVAEVAVEKPAPEPTLAAADTAPSDALIYGVGVTGSAQDPTLGADIEHILGPSKKDKKGKAAEDSGAGEGSFPHAFHLSGQAIGGYYRADGNDGNIFHDASPIASLHLDASGYLYQPGFLSFSVRPQAGLGRQSSEDIFPDGRGVAATTTFLGGGTIPLTLSYTRLNRNLVTFGPLDRLAGLEANTFQDSLSANWTLRLKRMPQVALNFSKFFDSYEPLANLAPKTANSARLGSVDVKDNVMGWNLETRYKVERSSQDLINIFDPTQAPYLFKRDNREARASADRDFGNWLSLAFAAGITKSQNVQDRPFDLSYRFYTANSIVRPTKKLTLTFHSGVTHNVVGATLERTASATASPADTPSPLVPASAKLQMSNYSVSAQYALTKDLHLHADALRETTSPQQATAGFASGSSLNSAQAGISWSRRLRFVRFQSHYAVNIGNFLYGSAGSSRSSGHKAELGATVGSLHTLELTAGLQGSMQDVTGNSYMRDRSGAASLTLSHAFAGQWKLQAVYDRARDSYNLLNQQFSSDRNGFSLVLVNPRFDFSASHNISNGLSIQTDPRLQYLSSTQAGMLLGAFPGALMVPTGADWSSAAVTLHPFGKFRARGAWMRTRQQLEGTVNNRYTEWEASAGYQFRSLNFDAGYIFHDQNFGLDLSQRNRLFFRAVRDFTIF